MGEGDHKKIEGIKGWLLVFVIVLVLSTLGDIVNIIGNVALFSAPSIDAININPVLNIVNIALTSILIILEIAILYLIFKKKQKAIRWVIVTFIYMILYVGVWSFVRVSFSIGILSALGESVVNIPWILYFIKSKRVKNTLIN